MINSTTLNVTLARAVRGTRRTRAAPCFRFHPQCVFFWMCEQARSPRQGSSLYAKRTAEDGEDVSLTVLNSPLQTAASSVYVRVDRPLNGSETFHILQSGQHPLQPANATACLSEDVQQVRLASLLRCL